MSDFIKPPSQTGTSVNGVGGAHHALLCGTVRWSIEDDDGRVHEIVLPNTYYVDSIPFRLLSPQHWAATYDDNKPARDGTRCITYTDRVVLQWAQRKFTRTVPLAPDTRIAVLRTAPSVTNFTAFTALLDMDQDLSTTIRAFPTLIPADDDDDDATIANPPPPLRPRDDVPPPMTHDGATEEMMDDRPAVILDEYTENMMQNPDRIEFEFFPSEAVDENEMTMLDDPVHELVRIHHKLNHLPYSQLREMAQCGIIPTKLQHIKPPFCAVCSYGKAIRKPWRTKGVQKHMKDATFPGECVSVDQMESSTPGFVAQMKGKLTVKRYRVATIFTDHYSRLSYVHVQPSTSGADTLDAKHAFERYARSNDVQVRHYHADNGRFADNAFVKDVGTAEQSISYCGVNAHHQNGIAERRIRELTERARTAMINAQLRWPGVITTNLWPYALRTVNYIHSITPQLGSTVSPIEKFTGIDVRPNLKDVHHFGCPAYVLDAKLQAQQNLSKWNSRSRAGIYLGPSLNHARSVSLVMNPETGLVSCQFHVQFDDFFESIRNPGNGPSLQPAWHLLAGFDPISGHHQEIQQGNQQDNNQDATPDANQANQANQGPRGASSNPDSRNVHEAFDFLPLSEGDADPFASTLPPSVGNPYSSEGATDHDLDTVVASNIHQNEGAAAPYQAHVPTFVDNNYGAEQFATAPSFHSQSEGDFSQPIPLRRTSRIRKPTSRLLESHRQRSMDKVAMMVLNSEIATFDYIAEQEYRIQDRTDHPVAFAASTNPDILYMHQAMKAPDRVQFLQAMQEEVLSHESNGHWIMIPLNEVPEGVKVLDSIWAMRRKRRIDTREVYKWKARLNLHGGQQEEGVNFWRTDSPVVNWFSLRYYFVISILQNWYTRQIDFVLAFPQADAECELYMKVPKGFEAPGEPKALKVVKNIYGSKQAGRVFNQHLDKGLRSIGFTPSAIDPCVYHRGSTVFLVYVDDGIFTGPNKDDIDQAISDLRAVDFTIEDQGDLNDYLGIKINKRNDGTMELTQPQIIASILEDLNFQANTRIADTPALVGEVLQRDEDGPSAAHDVPYSKIVGKLNFLEKSTRPDISFAVHQCARFSANPKQSHVAALRRIGRYLKGTSDKGMIIDPNNSGSFECWADADFAGNYEKDNPHRDVDAMTAKSRSGYVIMYAGTPLVWGSKLQTEVALSTTEAEYISLSTALRETIHLMRMLEEAREFGVPMDYGAPVVRCKAFEDNSGAVALANVPKMRPRTKHINCRYHHFRSYVSRGIIDVAYVSTHDQIADVLTKSLSEDAFCKFRKLIMGW
jgi:hypothetical protein